MAYASINKSSLHMNTKLWTGTGSNGNAISGIGFAPDLVWVKNRSETFDHVLFDRVRGDNKHIESNNTSTEENEANTLAFGSDGYSVGTNTLNKSSNNIVAWNWKAGTTSSISGGSTTPSGVSINTSSGFGIYKYGGTGSAGATIAHGLGVAPKMIIIKRLDNANDWLVGHEGLDATNPWHKYIYLNQTSAVADATNIWNDTAPTSTLITLGAHGLVNGDTENYIMYAFTEKTGYSKFGSYTGNGNANGAFVYTGFKPAFVIIKGAVSGDGNAAQNWELYDNKRIGHNPNNYTLFPNTTAVDSDGDRIDLLSNGFKIRINSDGVNDNNSTYIYMAFAEEPLVANVGASIPATAR